MGRVKRLGEVLEVVNRPAEDSSGPGGLAFSQAITRFIREKLNADLLKVGGHFGYGVLPEFRRQGFATEILRQGLNIALKSNLARVLVTCRDGNLASKKTIEACGGVQENTVIDPNSDPNSASDNPQFLERRYWIDLV